MASGISAGAFLWAVHSRRVNSLGDRGRPPPEQRTGTLSAHCGKIRVPKLSTAPSQHNPVELGGEVGTWVLMLWQLLSRNCFFTDPGVSCFLPASTTLRQANILACK